MARNDSISSITSFGDMRSALSRSGFKNRAGSAKNGAALVRRLSTFGMGLPVREDSADGSKSGALLHNNGVPFPIYVPRTWSPSPRLDPTTERVDPDRWPRTDK